MRFVNGLNLKFKRRVKDESNTVGLSNLKNRATVYHEEEQI